MGIALIIVGGLVLMTGLASYFSYLTEKKKRVDSGVAEKVEEVEKRLAQLEHRIEERDERLSQLESDVSFVNKLIEEKK